MQSISPNHKAIQRYYAELATYCDPNRADDPEYIARLVGRVVTVSLETVRLVRELEGEVDLLAALGMKEEAVEVASRP
jgi:hypothetical protein